MVAMDSFIKKKKKTYRNRAVNDLDDANYAVGY